MKTFSFLALILVPAALCAQTIRPVDLPKPPADTRRPAHIVSVHLPTRPAVVAQAPTVRPVLLPEQMPTSILSSK